MRHARIIHAYRVMTSCNLKKKCVFGFPLLFVSCLWLSGSHAEGVVCFSVPACPGGVSRTSVYSRLREGFRRVWCDVFTCPCCACLFLLAEQVKTLYVSFGLSGGSSKQTGRRTTADDGLRQVMESTAVVACYHTFCFSSCIIPRT